MTCSYFTSGICGVPSERIPLRRACPRVAPWAGMRRPVGAKGMAIATKFLGGHRTAPNRQPYGPLRLKTKLNHAVAFTRRIGRHGEAARSFIDLAGIEAEGPAVADAHDGHVFDRTFYQ